MTKTITFLLVLFILTIGMKTFGQVYKFEIGIEGCPSFISMRGFDLDDSSFRKTDLGFSAGLFFQYNFNKIISLRTNISYERKGDKIGTAKHIYYLNFDPNPTEIDKTVELRYEYLTLPILVRLNFGKKIKYFVNAGPYFGYLIKDSEIIKWDNHPSIVGDFTWLDKRYDIGISTGLGLSVPIEKKIAVSLEVRDNLGLLNISAVPVWNNGTNKTNSLNFLFGITYKLGHKI